MLQLQAMGYIETTPPSPPLHTYMAIADKVLRVLLAAAMVAIIIDSAMGWMSLRTLSDSFFNLRTRCTSYDPERGKLIRVPFYQLPTHSMFSSAVYEQDRQQSLVDTQTAESDDHT